ncbi:hypothetical protein B7494_g3974 [Chlorociboria aeruginascens]|nr:hypothetical protein B7494_g3974 [Chlorociboria aeruginascens]
MVTQGNEPARLLRAGGVILRLTLFEADFSRLSTNEATKYDGLAYKCFALGVTLFAMVLTVQQQRVGLLVLPIISALFILKGPSFSRPKYKTTYRVRNIPDRFTTRDECRFLIESILSNSDTRCNITIRTFASSFDHRQGRTTITRMVTFDLEDIIPVQLKPNAKNEWTFKNFDFLSQQTGEYLTIDTHFVGFTVLSSPEDENHEFDLVAISGLGSHAWGSFKKRSEKSMWLADKLPQDWPQARIMIYGYQSPIMGSNSRQTLMDIAKTFSNNLIKMRSSLNVSSRRVPLVFLAHSLGGLVVKQALINLSKQSKIEPGTQEPFQSTCAMLFFGVPCKGLDGEILGLAAMAKGQSTEGFLSDLRRNSPMVDTLAQNFLSVFQNRNSVQIYSFYETVESPTAVMSYFGRPSLRGPRKHWVDKTAAFNGRDLEREEDEKYSISLETDHSSLVKCEDENTFKTISNVLKDLDWVSATRAMASYKEQGSENMYRARQGGSPQYYKVDEAVEYFTGRDDFIDEIHRKLTNTTATTPSIAIWGLSGTGKTETVLKYAFKYQSQYSTICLFNARSEKDLTTSMTSFFDFLADRKDARLTKISGYSSTDKSKDVKRWLEEEHNWLAIYDDVDLESGYNFRSYLPQHCDGHRILIGRSNSIMKFADDELWMTGMSDRDATRMLLKRAGLTNPTTTERLNAERIVLELDNMPFFIEYAASYIREVQGSLQEYLAILRNQKANMVLGHASGNPGDKLASWELSYHELQKHDLSMMLLKLFAFLDGSCISMTLLKRGSSNRMRWSEAGTKIDRPPEWSMVDTGIRILLQDPEQLNSALKPLLNRSFARRERDGNIKIPKLVQRLVIRRLSPEELLNWTKKAICFVSHSFPEEADLEQPFESLRSALTPHVFRCMDHAREFPVSELYSVTFQLVSMLLSVLAGSWKQMELIDYANLLLAERNNVYYRCLAAKWEAYMLWHKKADSQAAALLSRTRRLEELKLAATGTALAEDFLTAEVSDYRGHAALGDLTMHQAQFLFKGGHFKDGEIILKRWRIKSNSEMELRTQLYIDTALAKSLLCQDKISEAVDILERLVLVPEAHGTGAMQPEKYHWATALLAQGYCALGSWDKTITLLSGEVHFRQKKGLQTEFITSDFRLYLAEAYVRTHQYKEASALLLKLENALGNALQADNPRAQGQLVATKSLEARALYMQKSWTPACMAWIDYLTCLSVDEADITDLTWQKGYDVEIGILSLAVVYYHLGNTAKANQYIKIIESDPNALQWPVGETDYTKWLLYLQADYRDVRMSWFQLKWRACLQLLESLSQHGRNLPLL